MPNQKLENFNRETEAAVTVGQDGLVMKALLRPVLAAIEAEPVPTEIRELAEEFDAALASNRAQASKPN